jgi:hypothetical protein
MFKFVPIIIKTYLYNENNLLFAILIVITSLTSKAQITELNSNTSLEAGFPISANKAVFISSLDSSIWVTDGTPGGTTQISSDVKVEDAGNDWNMKLVTNPVQNDLKVMLNGITGQAHLSIKDLNGKTLYTRTSTANGLINIPIAKLTKRFVCFSSRKQPGEKK